MLRLRQLSFFDAAYFASRLITISSACYADYFLDFLRWDFTWLISLGCQPADFHAFFDIFFSDAFSRLPPRGAEFLPSFDVIFFFSHFHFSSSD